MLVSQVPLCVGLIADRRYDGCLHKVIGRNPRSMTEMPDRPEAPVNQASSPQDDLVITPGMQRYIDQAQADLAQRDVYIRDVVKKWRFDTIAVHGLYQMQAALEGYQGAIMEPLFLSSSQGYRDADEMSANLAGLIPNWGYSRLNSPSTTFYEWTLALLEGYGCDEPTTCASASSGMAALVVGVLPFLTHQFKSLNEPKNIVATAQCFGGTFAHFTNTLKNERGVETRWVRDAANLDEWASKIDSNTRFLFGELPSNPQLGFFDLKAVADLAHEHNLPLIIDSTVATPALLRPICHGADVVIQSVTKTLSASGFGMAGAVIAKKNITTNIDNDLLRSDYGLFLKTPGNRDQSPNLHPMQAMLSLTDIRSVRGRMDQFSQTAQRVAEWLETHPAVESVAYLGLPSHPKHELAQKYLFLADSEYDPQYGGQRVNRYGQLLSFNVKGGVEAAKKVLNALKLIWRATDLGRIKSIAAIPSISTHQRMGKANRKLANVAENMVRISVGGEHADDLINDLDQALAAAK